MQIIFVNTIYAQYIKKFFNAFNLSVLCYIHLDLSIIFYNYLYKKYIFI